MSFILDDERPKISGSGPIATAPAPSKGKLWVDGAMVYGGQQIADFSGDDYITFTSRAKAAQNVRCVFQARYDGSGDVGIFTSSGSTTGIRFGLTTTGARVLIGGNDGFEELILPFAKPVGWSTYDITLGEGGIYVKLNGTEVYNRPAPSKRLDVNSSQIVRVGRYVNSVSQTITRGIASVKIWYDGVLGFDVDCNKDLTSTTLLDTANNDLGVITDASPSGVPEMTWVPIIGDNIAGYGSLSNAPTPTEALRNKIFIEAGDPLYPNGRVWQYKYVFKNAGIDGVSLGRPTNLVNLLEPQGSAYRVRVEYVRDSIASWAVLVGFGGISVPTRQLAIGIEQNTNNAVLQIGGGGNLLPSRTQGLGKWGFIDFTLPASGNNGLLKTDIGDAVTSVRGTSTNPGNIFIGCLNDYTDNGEVKISKVEFFDGNNNLVDRVDFGDTVQWNGGASGVTWAGSPFNVIDSTPAGTRVVDLVPNDFQNDLVGIGTLAAAPAPSIDLLGKKYEQTDDPLYPNGRMWKYRYVFNNNGNDFIDLGRPTNIVNLIDVAKNFTITAVFKFTDLDAQGVVFGNDTDAFANRTTLRINNTLGDRKYYGQVRGAVSADADILYSGGYVRLSIVANGSKFNVVRPNGTLSSNTTIGSNSSITNFRVSSSTFEGTFAYLEFWDEWGNLVDRLNMDDWDGTATGRTYMGNPYIVSDVAPLGARIIELVPDQW